MDSQSDARYVHDSSYALRVLPRYLETQDASEALSCEHKLLESQTLHHHDDCGGEVVEVDEGEIVLL